MARRDEKGYIHYTLKELNQVPPFEVRAGMAGAGTGTAGGLAGAATGAVLGSPAGPIGTLAGGIAGGVAGNRLTEDTPTESKEA